MQTSSPWLIALNCESRISIKKLSICRETTGAVQSAGPFAKIVASTGMSILSTKLVHQRKRGFASNVVDDWFSGAMSGKMHDTFMDGESKMYQYLKSEAVQQLYRGTPCADTIIHKILFCLIVFENV
jgi:hypothetical protein